MKAIIEVNETNLAAIKFKKSNKDIDWKDLSMEEQIKILNAMTAYYNLYINFIKSE